MEPKVKARLSLAARSVVPEPTLSARDATSEARDVPQTPASAAFTRDASDLELLGRYHTGDHAAFAMLLSRYQGPIFSFLFRSLGERQAAEDLTQETFLRVIQGSSGFQSQAKFSTWLFAIARNLCVDQGRRMRHRRHASLEASASDAEGGSAQRLVERLRALQPGTDRSAASSRIRERVAHAVAHLPDEQREVFLLRQVQDLAFAEIATICGIPENTVKSRMRYALERLQKSLADYEDDASAS